MPLPPKPNDFLGGSGNALVASRVVKSGSNQPNEPPVIISVSFWIGTLIIIYFI